MRLPPELTIAGWRRFVDALLTARGRSLDVDLGPILPPDQRLGRLSTGEAKRLLLEAMLRRPAPFVLLDEPYEHLSAGARAVLTDCLIARSRDAVVVVATNQPVPVRAHGSVLRLSAGVDTHPRLEVVT